MATYKSVCANGFVGVDTLEEIIDEFNMEEPYTNYKIGGVVKNMLTVFVEESIKLYDDDEVTLTDMKTSTNYGAKSFNKHRYTRNSLKLPITYMLSITKILTNKDINLWNGDVNNAKKDNGDPLVYPCFKFSNALERTGKTPCLSHNDYEHVYTFCYSSYKTLLHESLVTSYDSTTKHWDQTTAHNVFEDKCKMFYHAILEHVDEMTYAFADIDKHRVGDSYSLCVFTKFLSDLPNMPSDMVNNYTDKFCNYTEHVSEFSEFALKGVSCRNVKKLQQHKLFMDKLFCETIAYGYIDEKIKFRKLAQSPIMSGLGKVGGRVGKSVNYDDVIKCVNGMVLQQNHKQQVKTMFSDLLYRLDISTIASTAEETGISWCNSDECFEFLTHSVYCILSSEKSLLKLMNKDSVNPGYDVHNGPTSLTPVRLRIRTLKGELKSSRSYLSLLFSQFIMLKKREMENLA